MTSNCDVTKNVHQMQMTTIWPWTKPPHENFLRAPLNTRLRFFRNLLFQKLLQTVTTSEMVHFISVCSLFVFLISSGKKQISSLLTPWKKFFRRPCTVSKSSDFWACPLILNSHSIRAAVPNQGHICPSARVHLLCRRNKFTLTHKNGVHFHSSKSLKVLLKIQWISVIVFNLFVIRKIRGTCSSVEMLKGYMVKESLAIPGLEPDLLAAQVEQSAICTAHRPGAQNAPPRCTKALHTAPVHKSACVLHCSH